MGRLFGTDGVRGKANRDITAPLALNLAVAAARVLTKGEEGGRRPLAVVGRDSRISGDFLSAAVSAGLASAGVDVIDVGVLPTPAIAYLTAQYKAHLGVVLSASHNAMPDNGIKFLASGGHKLSDDAEDAIESLLNDQTWQPPVAEGVGRISRRSNAGKEYVDHLVSTIDGSLKGLKIAVDCANGAASSVGPAALRAAGADVVVINAEPTGLNINDNAGSTHPERLQAAVVEHGCDFGVAFDGDADRCLAADGAGELVDGDQIMGVLAKSLRDSGKLISDTLVVTVMSNLGLRLAMEQSGVRVVETAVGDRYVLEAMRAGGYVLGGEQSGHVILTDYATTGDGALTALQLAAVVAQTGKSLGELAAQIQRLPQKLINVSGVDRTQVTTNAALNEAVSDARRQLSGKGRVLLRPSGTEPLVRVMVEAATQEQADEVAQRLASVVSEHLAI